MNRYTCNWPVRSVETVIIARPIRPDKNVLAIENIVCPATVRALTGVPPACWRSCYLSRTADVRTYYLSDPSPCTPAIVNTYLFNSTVGLSFDVHDRDLIATSFLAPLIL